MKNKINKLDTVLIKKLERIQEEYIEQDINIYYERFYNFNAENDQNEFEYGNKMYSKINCGLKVCLFLVSLIGPYCKIKTRL